MSTPNIDLEELKKLKKDIFKDRLKFINQYAEWIKKTSNKKWSSQQDKISG